MAIRGVLKEQVGWYEATLPLKERRSRGHFSTPPRLVEHFLDACGYRSAQQRGHADSYLLFLNLGLQIVRPNGWLGLVLPDPLLARTNAARERAHLLKEFTIHHLWHLADVFAAHVGAVVIVAQKCPPPGTHQISWVREKWQKTLIGDSVVFTSGEYHGIPDQIIPQSLLLHQPGAELRYLLSTEQGPTIERLRAYFDNPPASQRRLAPLSDFVSIRRGEELGMGNSLLIHEDQKFNENRVTYSPNRACGQSILHKGRA